jgi:RAB protein geranylgeranyltransferase component A
LINIQRYTSVKTKRIAREVTIIKSTIDKLEEKFTNMNNTMNNIHHTLNLLLEKNGK